MKMHEGEIDSLQVLGCHIGLIVDKSWHILSYF